MATLTLGKVAVTPAGEYSPSKTYEPLDFVQYQGSGYLVRKQCTGIEPQEGEYYMLAAQRGRDGIDGGGGGESGEGGGTPTGAMLQAVYDPQKKRTDIFQYAEQKKQEAVQASIPKVNGTRGQFLGFTENDVVGAVDAPSGGGGTGQGAGKRARKTIIIGTEGNGYEKEDCDIFLNANSAIEDSILDIFNTNQTFGADIFIRQGDYKVTKGDIKLTSSNFGIIGESNEKTKLIFADDIINFFKLIGTNIVFKNIHCTGNNNSGAILSYDRNLIINNKFDGSIFNAPIVAFGNGNTYIANNRIETSLNKYGFLLMLQSSKNMVFNNTLIGSGSDQTSGIILELETRFPENKECNQNFICFNRILTKNRYGLAGIWFHTNFTNKPTLNNVVIGNITTSINSQDLNSKGWLNLIENNLIVDNGVLS